MGLKGILSLLSKAGKRVFSPATRARNLPYQGSPTAVASAQTRKLQAAQRAMMADPVKRKMYNESMEAAKREVDKLIREGVVDTNRRLETYRLMEDALVREYTKLPQYSDFTAFPSELIRSLGTKAAWTALGLGAGGAAGYYAGTRSEDEAVEEMEEATQTKSRGTEVGENIANTLMDIISPIPRYK
jgi:hypothetical protein